MSSQRRRVVVTGMGVVTPLGLDVETSWDAVKSGKSGVSNITLFDAAGYRTTIAAEVNAWDASAHFDRKDSRRLDRFCEFFVVACRQAIAQSGLDVSDDEEKAARSGVIVGAGFGGMKAFIDEAGILFERGPSRVTPIGVLKTIPNLAAGFVSIEHNLTGPVSCVVTACAASANAIGDAVEVVRRGAADVMVAGGAEASITTLAVASFSQARALSTRNDDPAGASRPFDADRDGFVMGEGGAAMVLESFEHARRRGAEILGEVTGYGMSADAYHITLPRPGGTGAARSMTAAMNDAGLEGADLGYINAHGTSTVANDGTETAAVKLAFGDDAARDIPMSSTKSMTGHLLGAAGAAEGVFSVMAIRDQVLPPTINLATPDPKCDLDYVPNETREAAIDHVMSNSFGFGGHNVSLVFSRFA